MKQLFLAASISKVALHIKKYLPDPVGRRLAFINTAAEGDHGDKSWLKEDREALVNMGYDVFDYTITGKNSGSLRTDLMTSDVIFVSGGNTFYLLEKIQQSGFKTIIQEFVNQGKPYIGSSAGSVVAGPDVYPVINLDAVEKAPNLNGYEGLQLTDVVVLPHWGSDEYKDAYLYQRSATAYNTKNKIILLTDNQYLYIKDDWYRVEEHS
jgi:dipeptidase E